ncbi:magnesium transporter CorA [Pelomonas sp. Root1217]|uniref:magnesium transporter CorA family protein n=1 Tax=unclassified Roseateles TaxID=2626991 RepID=UPI0006F9C6DB|nr:MULTISPECIES: magnesium transporter CorA family protein [unclassified Roseateles]KQV55479.1 magnesium transporter CorA [Pelomonas sp. Root1217]KQV94505.1 magnesium transporter CorA [Pelomonas sp. Root1237]
MRVFHIETDSFRELAALPEALPERGFLWVGYGRREFEVGEPAVQQALARWGCGNIVDLHVSDLINNQLPSHFDYTSWYDMLVFRRLAAAPGSQDLFVDDEHGTLASAQRALRAIDTSPVGFAVFDRVLITVHPTDCQVREFFAQKLDRLTEGREKRDARGGARLPASPADLMLRMVNHMVDSYLELRRLLTRQLGTLQRVLLDQSSEFDDWPLLLESRDALHRLEDTCEDQRAAIQEWIDALDEWPVDGDPQVTRERELLRVRSRDVLEHVERVLTHVRRLESSAESAVQMHFSALGHRTNSIMRTLTVLTAIFLPLNLITGIFGMNFEWMPLIKNANGFWDAALLMLAVALGLWFLFRRKRYLSSSR